MPTPTPRDLQNMLATASARLAGDTQDVAEELAKIVSALGELADAPTPTVPTPTPTSPRIGPRGHYFAPSPTTTVPQIWKRIDDPKASHLAGVYFQKGWGDLENADGTFGPGMTEVLDVIDGCAQRGKGCVLALKIKHFNSPITDDMIGRPAPIGVPIVTHKKAQPAQMAAIFDLAVIARLCWFCQRLATVVDVLPGLHGLDTSETAPGPDLTTEQKKLLVPAFMHHYRALASAFKRTRAFANINFGDDAPALRDFANEIGLGLSCADMIPTAVNATRPAGMPFLAAMSLEALSPTKERSMQSAYALARDRKADAAYWVDWLKSPADWASILAFTAANPLPIPA